MVFGEVLGLETIKNHLITSANAGRVPHAQLFVGPEGCGVLPMVLAYAQHLLCGTAGGEGEVVHAACTAKCEGLTHPDLHFAFPVATSNTVKSHAVSDRFLEQWREFVKEQPYGNLFDWYRQIGIEKKQGQIGVDEAQDIVKKLSLKSYEGGYKVLIVWMAEKMNSAAANKLLKLIEEPPQQTVFLLLAEDEEQIITTVRSRCQLLRFPPLAEAAIFQALRQKGVSEDEAHAWAHEAHGNFNKALDLWRKDSEDVVFERWFVQWARSAFKAKRNKGAILELLRWSEEMAKTGREAQKQFLGYCLRMIRQALLLNYKVPSLVYAKIQVEGFSLHKFAPFVHENNILELVEELEKAIFHIERNANSKLVFTDLSMILTRLLHRKAA